MLRGGFAIEAFTHHFGADADLPVGSLVRIAHAMATVVVPVIIILASCALTFLAPRGCPSDAPHGEPAVVAFSSADRPRASGSEGVSRSDEGEVQPVDRFYRVTFANEAAFREWTKRVVEFTALLEDVAADVMDPRPRCPGAPGARRHGGNSRDVDP
jgi:hypothetical protein